jgi:hypothetical protein
LARMRDDEARAAAASSSALVSRSSAGVFKPSVRERTIGVTISAPGRSHRIAVLRVRVLPRPFVVHRTLRYFTAETEYLSAEVTIPGSLPSATAAAVASASASASSGTGGGDLGTFDGRRPTLAAPGRYVHCPDDEVVVESNDELGGRRVRLKYRAGRFPSAGDFYLLLFNDPYAVSLHECWHVVVHALQKYDLHSTAGQRALVDVGVRGTGPTSRTVAVHSSHPSILSSAGPTEFSLVAGAYNRVTLSYNPVQAGCRAMQVHVVDTSTHELISAWRITATASAPHISRVYDVAVPCRETSSKKLSWHNPWEFPRTFRVRSADPSVLGVKRASVEVPGGESTFLKLRFHPAPLACTKHVYLFVNDEEDQNVETLLVRVRFIDRGVGW